MRNFFRVVGVLTLFVFGFIYTEKTSTVMQNMDDIMIQIKAVSNHYKENPIEAVLENNEMIPGIVGKQVDIKKSYNHMKRVGYFNSGLFEYKKIYPKERLSKNYKHYIVGGNPVKDMVSIIFMVEKNVHFSKLEKIMEIAENKGSKLNFFLDGYWFEENNDMVNHIVLNDHELGNLSYDLDYKDSSFVWMDTIIKRLTHKKFSYCYSEQENKLYLDICNMYKNYTIKPSFIIEKDPYSTIKKEATAGSIISMKVTEQSIDQLSSILTYLNNKGYKVVTLTEHLEETR